MNVKDRIEIVQGDITEEKVDAIVNAANTDLILGVGVAGAIYKKGGQVIQDECDAHGPVKLGRAAITSGGDLPAKHVIHAATMKLGGRPTEDSIRRATLNSLTIASYEKMKTISFPALGTGVGGFAMEAAAKIMLIATLEFLKENEYPQKVRFVLFDEEGREVFEGVFKELF